MVNHKLEIQVYYDFDIEQQQIKTKTILAQPVAQLLNLKLCNKYFLISMLLYLQNKKSNLKLIKDE